MAENVAAPPAGMPSLPPPIPAALWEPVWQRHVVCAAASLIANHYRVPLGAALRTIERFDCDLDRELRRPFGFTLLGRRVAGALIGEDEAAALPPLLMQIH